MYHQRSVVEVTGLGSHIVGVTKLAGDMMLVELLYFGVEIGAVSDRVPRMSQVCPLSPLHRG